MASKIEDACAKLLPRWAWTVVVHVLYYLSNSFSAQSESGLGMLYSPPFS